MTHCAGDALGLSYHTCNTLTDSCIVLPQGMFLLLVTNRGSNILEDLDTLRMLSKLVPEYAGTMLDEVAVSRAAFDLIFAFDEVISHGHKENITVQQVKQNCEMESHEEKLHKMIIQSKINDTKDIMKRKAMEIDKHKMEQKRTLPTGPGFNNVMGGMGGGGMGSMARPAGMDMDAGRLSTQRVTYITSHQFVIINRTTVDAC